MENEIVPNDPIEVGNTSSIGATCSPSKKWILVLNNYDYKDCDSIREFVMEKCRYAIIAREKGEEGTPHLQGYFELTKKNRPVSLMKKYSDHKRWHFEKAKQSKEINMQYVLKDGDIMFQWPRNWAELKLYWWQKDLLKELKKEPDDRTIRWIYEEAGCAGKTTFQKYIYNMMNGVIVVSGKLADMKNGVAKYEEKTGLVPRIVLINIPRVSAEYVSIAGIEAIKDMFFYSGKYEGAMVCGPNPHVVCFANSGPPYGDMSEDRWMVTDISEEPPCFYDPSRDACDPGVV